MFCNACGSPIPDNARFCGKCGKPVLAAGPATTQPLRSRLARHLPVLAMLWVVYSVLRVLGGAAALFAGSAIGMYMPHLFMYGWPFAHRFFLPGLITGVGVGLLALGVVGVAAAWGLWQREPWARIALVILGALSLFHFPLGTALGIYTFWVLLPNDAAAEYARVPRPL